MEKEWEPKQKDGMKTCKKCELEKAVLAFYKVKNGLFAVCKDCHKQRTLAWKKTAKGREANNKYQKTEKRKAYLLAYGKTDKSKAYRKEYRKKDIYKEYHKKYDESGKTNESRKKWKLNNIDKVKVYNLAYDKEWKKKRKAESLSFKLSIVLRSRMCSALKRGYKSGSAVKDLGCSIQEFKEYIEKQFEPGMSWENYGVWSWHLDHKLPLSSFDLTDREQFLKAAHYTNQQPLLAKDNLVKGAKLVWANT